MILERSVDQLAIATPSMHLVFAPALLPDVESNSVSLLLGADEVQVVGDEELASASHRGSPRRHKEGGAKIRGPFVTLQLPKRRGRGGGGGGGDRKYPSRDIEIFFLLLL